MSTTRSKDRAGLCSFTFANGHRCRSLCSTSHPHLCYYHARKESQARAAEEIGRDISYFFSGRYLSACDLTAVLARLFSAAATGELKPKTASILAYLAQTLLQTIHLAQHEYINAFGTDSWRRAVASSVNDNSNHRNPPAPQPAGAQRSLRPRSLSRLSLSPPLPSNRLLPPNRLLPGNPTRATNPQSNRPSGAHHPEIHSSEFSLTLHDYPTSRASFLLPRLFLKVRKSGQLRYYAQVVSSNPSGKSHFWRLMMNPKILSGGYGLHTVGRIGEIKEVVDAILFLTDATFTTGEVLHVDGGAHAGKW